MIYRRRYAHSAAAFQKESLQTDVQKEWCQIEKWEFQNQPISSMELIEPVMQNNNVNENFSPHEY